MYRGSRFHFKKMFVFLLSFLAPTRRLGHSDTAAATAAQAVGRATGAHTGRHPPAQRTVDGTVVDHGGSDRDDGRRQVAGGDGGRPAPGTITDQRRDRVHG